MLDFHAFPRAADLGSPARMQDARPPIQVPEDALIIVPVRGLVLFPGVVLPVTVGRARSIAAAQQAVRESRQVG
ncbi:MAG: LON peptidase substrate-binding domain-containing protein, partial [Methylobacteriaceae bacterium]|nr:LON peptidase substrate-binding domain-containing protein [Methylobacteriaceae bacterium]